MQMVVCWQTYRIRYETMARPKRDMLLEVYFDSDSRNSDTNCCIRRGQGAKGYIDTMVASDTEQAR